MFYFKRWIITKILFWTFEFSKNTDFIRNYQKNNKIYENIMLWMKLTPSLSFILKYAKGSFKTTTWHISMCCYKNYIKLVQIYRYQRSKLDIMSHSNCCFFNLSFRPSCLHYRFQNHRSSSYKLSKSIPLISSGNTWLVHQSSPYSSQTWFEELSSSISFFREDLQTFATKFALYLQNKICTYSESIMVRW